MKVTVFIPMGKGADGTDYGSAGPAEFNNEENAFAYAVSVYRSWGYSVPAAEHRAGTLPDYTIYRDKE